MWEVKSDWAIEFKLLWYFLDLYCASAKWRVQIDRLELSLKAKLLYTVIEGLLHSNDWYDE